jgi:hypothetical protein
MLNSIAEPSCPFSLHLLREQETEGPKQTQSNTLWGVVPGLVLVPLEQISGVLYWEYTMGLLMAKCGVWASFRFSERKSER